MNNQVQFNEPNYGGNPYMRQQGNKGLVGWLISKGYAKDRKQANNILLGVAIGAVLLMIFMWPSSNSYVHVPQPGDPGYVAPVMNQY